MDLNIIKDNLGNTIPDKYMENISRDILDKLDLLINEDSELEDTLFDNLVNFKEILMRGKTNVKSFVNATLFVSYYLLGNSKTVSYSKVFPERLLKFNSESKSNTNINNTITAYFRSVLVQQLLNQCMMPSHVMFRNVFFEAVKVQVDIMQDDKVSSTVRQKAACSLMGHLKEPEVQKVELEVTSNSEVDMIKELMKATNSLAKQQKEAITDGQLSSIEIAHSDIIEGVYNEK